MNPQRKPRVFISRTTVGLAGLADELAAVLRTRGIEPVIQTEFLQSWRTIRQKLQDELLDCDCVIALLGPAYGAPVPDPVDDLDDLATRGRSFSYTQLEYLLARQLQRPIFTCLLDGPELIADFPAEDTARADAQRAFIAEFVKVNPEERKKYTSRAQLLDAARQWEFPTDVSAGRPNNLPQKIGPLFKGRDEFLRTLRASFTTSAGAIAASGASPATIIHGKQAIHGMGGVGKTRAAIEYGWTHAIDYCALLFLTADSAEALIRNLAALCGPLVLNLPEQTARETEVQVSAVVRWLQRPRSHGWFLLIDNVDTPAAQAAVRELLEKIPHGHILITSRLADWPATFTSLDLDVLSEASSVELLLTHTAGRRTEQPDDPTHAAQIAQLLDGLALALEQAAAFVRKDRRTFADYLAAWESTRVRVYEDYHEKGLDDYHAKKYLPDVGRSLFVTYETSLSQLSEPALELFRLLAWVAPDPMPMVHVENIKNFADPRALVVELTDFCLARLTPDGTTCSLHRLLQEISRQQQPEPQPPALFAALAWVNGEYPNEPNDVRTWPVAIPLTPHAIAVATFGADREIAEPSDVLLSQTGLLLKTQADYGAAEPLQRRALAIDEASFGPDHPYVAIRLNNLAQLLQDTNRLDEAEPLMRRALAIDEASFGSDHPEVAVRVNNLAQFLQAISRLADAEPLMRRALAMAEASFGPDHPTVALRLNNLASLLQDTNRVADAEPLMRRALAIAEASYGPDHPRVSSYLNNLAKLLQVTKRLAEAEPLMRRSVEIWLKFTRDMGRPHPDVMIALTNYAHLLMDMGHTQERAVKKIRRLQSAYGISI